MTVKKVIIAMLIIGVIWIVPGYREYIGVVNHRASKITITIDPGHGGDDSGAIADDGTEEKNLNLEIAKKLQGIAERKGYNVKMTRTDDEGLYRANECKWSKLEDIHKRKEMIENSNCDVALLIHLNSYKSDSGVRGAQVFYSNKGDEQACEESEQLALRIQESLKNGLSDGSDRKAMIKNDVYLLKNIERPTILVECGFLSNNFDLKNLKTPKFQQKIAVYIIKSISEYYSSRNMTI